MRPLPSLADDSLVNAHALDRPIFILGAHKSGTSLLRSLLDGLDGLVVFPRELHFFERSGLPVYYPLRQAAASDLAEEAFVQRVVEALRGDALDRNPYSDSPTFEGYDPELFEQAWRRGASRHAEEAPMASVDVLRDRYRRYVDALHESYAGTPLPPGARVVDKSIEYIEFADTLERMYPDAVFVHVVRNPYAVLIALRRLRIKLGAGYPYLAPILRSIELSAYAASRNRIILRDYTVVRFEDLVLEPEETMRAICSKIGVEFEMDATRPTVGGQHWKGNSTSGRAFAGIDAGPTEEWKQSITPAEIHAVNRMLPSSFWEELGYERLSGSRLSALRPARGERLLPYIKNRAIY